MRVGVRPIRTPHVISGRLRSRPWMSCGTRCSTKKLLSALCAPRQACAVPTRSEQSSARAGRDSRRACKRVLARLHALTMNGEDEAAAAQAENGPLAALLDIVRAGPMDGLRGGRVLVLRSPYACRHAVVVVLHIGETTDEAVRKTALFTHYSLVAHCARPRRAYLHARPCGESACPCQPRGSRTRTFRVLRRTF